MWVLLGAPGLGHKYTFQHAITGRVIKVDIGEVAGNATDHKGMRFTQMQSMFILSKWNSEYRLYIRSLRSKYDWD